MLALGTKKSLTTKIEKKQKTKNMCVLFLGSSPFLRKRQ
jgi:hypothetical protein